MIVVFFVFKFKVCTVSQEWHSMIQPTQYDVKCDKHNAIEGKEKKWKCRA